MSTSAPARAPAPRTGCGAWWWAMALLGMSLAMACQRAAPSLMECVQCRPLHAARTTATVRPPLTVTNAPKPLEPTACINPTQVQELVQRGEAVPLTMTPSAAALANADADAVAHALGEIAIEPGHRSPRDDTLFVALEVVVGAGAAPDSYTVEARGFAERHRGWEVPYRPTARSVVLQAMHQDGTASNYAMHDCECQTLSGCDDWYPDDPIRRWCARTTFARDVVSLRVRVRDQVVHEIVRSSEQPVVEAYVAGAQQARVLLRWQAAPTQQRMAAVRLSDHLFLVPASDAAGCFHELSGSGVAFHEPVAGQLATLFTLTGLGPTLKPLPALPVTASRRPLWGPVPYADLRALLDAHVRWAGECREPTAHAVPPEGAQGDASPRPPLREPCPRPEDGPARAVLDDMELGGVPLASVVLRYASLRGAGLARVTLDNSDLSGADLSGADLRRAHGRNLHLFEARLDGASAREFAIVGDLRRSSWRDADLREASLSGWMAEAVFAGADLRGARVIGVLAGVDLEGALLDGTDFSGSDLCGALHLSKAQLSSACGDAMTRLPDGLTLARCQ